MSGEGGDTGEVGEIGAQRGVPGEVSEEEEDAWVREG